MRKLILSVAALFAAPLHAAELEDSLRDDILAADAQIFDRGFNQCDLDAIGGAISEDVEFYHDQGGPDLDKAAFMEKFNANICALDGPKPSRRLTPESTTIHPMYNDGVLYGAIQNGSHSFYLEDADGRPRLTSTGQFSHFWRLTSAGWRLKRAFSFDHVPMGDLPPPLQDDFPAPVFGDDTRLLALMRQHDIPSLAVARIEAGQLQSVRVVGHLAAGRPAPLDAIYKVASLTKPVTTMTTLRLVDAGLWDLDEPLSNFYIDPELGGDPRLEQLTTRWILSHRSGLPNWRYLTNSGRLAFEFAPGTRQQYSGEGFEILRKALEAHFGEPLTELASRWVFVPAGMRDTHFVWSAEVDPARYAVPHDEHGKAISEPRHYEANAAANLLTTGEDYGRFLAFVARGAGLSEGIHTQMITPQGESGSALPWGLGWQIITLPDGAIALQHTGGDHGVKALALVIPHTDSATLLFENAENGLAIWSKFLEESLGDAGTAITRANLDQ